MTLDGRNFQGVFIPKGETKGDADTLIFTNGRFQSTACTTYGYGDAPYRLAKVGDAMHFEADTESKQYGKLLWRGVVRGNKLDATATMVRAGSPDTENWVVASDKR